MRQYRHGDVFLQEVAAIPKSAKRRKSEPQILQHGEATGHAHRIDTNAFVMEDRGGELYLRVKNAAALTHEEHNTIAVPPGNYRIVIQREYVAPEVTRNVLD